MTSSVTVHLDGQAAGATACARPLICVKILLVEAALVVLAVSVFSTAAVRQDMGEEASTRPAP